MFNKQSRLFNIQNLPLRLVIPLLLLLVIVSYFALSCHFPCGGQAIAYAFKRIKTGTANVMTTANKITIVRILLIPFFVVEVLYYAQAGDELHRLLALLSFAVAAICDGVDGYIARRYNQRSELGAILDPLADKLLLVSGIVVLTFDHEPYLRSVPLWLTGIIIGRDIVLLAGLVVIQMTVGKIRVRPRVTGKIATVLQMIIILWILLKWKVNWLNAWTLAAGVCTGVSGALYIWDGTRQLGSHPASSASQKQREP